MELHASEAIKTQDKKLEISKKQDFQGLLFALKVQKPDLSKLLVCFFTLM